MFPYYGDISGLHKALRNHRKPMERAYRKALGMEVFQLVREADRKILNESSFLARQYLEEVSKASSNTTNKFVAASSSEGEEGVAFSLGGEARNLPKKISCGFSFAQEGFDATAKNYLGWIDPYIAPYIHEYDHFVIWAIQPQPILSAVLLLAQRLKPTRMPLRLEDISKLVEKSGGTRDEMILTLYLGLWAFVLQEAYEGMTRDIDRVVMENLGYDVPESFFPIRPKRFVPLSVDFLEVRVVIPFGDVLFGLSLPERITILREWVKRIVPSDPRQCGFMESFASVTPEKIAFGDLASSDA